MSRAVPTLPSPKPYQPRSHPVIANGNVPPLLSPGLVRREAPALPRGFQVICTICRCSVSTTHETGSLDCMITKHERERSVAS